MKGMTEMAKEFKEWDKKFSAGELRTEREFWLSGFDFNEEIGRWDMCIQKWDNDFIRECVYLTNDSRDWQRFRVAMKGTTTHQKLYMLKQWYVAMCFNKPKDQWNINKCRIDNYIGALVRGGQLEPKTYKILK